jgi:hypothetical protein
MSKPSKNSKAWLDSLSDEEYAEHLDREDDDAFLDFAAVIATGAKAIHDKRRLQAELEEARADCDKWMKLCMDGDAARSSILGDLVVGLSSGVLKVDRSVEMPERFKDKAS